MEKNRKITFFFLFFYIDKNKQWQRMCQRTQPYTFVFCSLFANNAKNKK